MYEKRSKLTGYTTEIDTDNVFTFSTCV